MLCHINVGLIFGQCTVTCGNGIVTRQVVCVNHHQQIDENYCDPEGRPAKEQECNMPSCQPVYRHEYPGHLIDQDYPSIHKVHHSQDNTRNLPSPGGNQWRTGPWGAVSKLLFILNTFDIYKVINYQKHGPCQAGQSAAVKDDSENL